MTAYNFRIRFRLASITCDAVADPTISSPSAERVRRAPACALAGLPVTVLAFSIRSVSMLALWASISFRLAIDSGLPIQLAIATYDLGLEPMFGLAVSNSSVSLSIRFSIAILLISSSTLLPQFRYFLCLPAAYGFGSFGLAAIGAPRSRLRFRPYIRGIQSVSILSTSSPTLRLQLRSFSSGAGHPYVYDVIADLRLRSKTLRSIPDAISAVAFRAHAGSFRRLIWLPSVYGHRVS
jgi:hypothetical protein